MFDMYPADIRRIAPSNMPRRTERTDNQRDTFMSVVRKSRIRHATGQGTFKLF